MLGVLLTAVGTSPTPVIPDGTISAGDSCIVSDPNNNPSYLRAISMTKGTAQPTCDDRIKTLYNGVCPPWPSAYFDPLKDPKDPNIAAAWNTCADVCRKFAAPEAHTLTV